MDDRRLLSTTRTSAASVTRSNFSTVRRGFDPGEVRAYLDGLAREMQLLEARIQDLQHQLAEAQRRAENPVIDESTLASALGAQSAAILRSAHEEAGRVTADAQERSTASFTQAQERATAYLVEAQERAVEIVSEAESTAAQVDGQARAGAQRLVESARVNGEALVERAREQGRAIVEQAQEARKSVLSDLAVKRKALNVQIDQLRAARDSLQSSITTVRESVESVLGGLMSSDEGARAAAIEALRSRPVDTEPSDDEVLSSVPLREVPEATLIDTTQVEALATVEPSAPRAATEQASPDAVEEIFARLRKATLEEHGATAAPSRRTAPSAPAAAPAAISELFVRRDKALSGFVAPLVKKVKRALQDDQNVMIERLRGVEGAVTGEFEDEQAQRARYADAALGGLEEAAIAGATFAAAERGAAAATVDSSAADELAKDLAVTIVVALRKKITSESTGDGAERANAAYKEWRGARVERLCADAARRAFNSGIVAACDGAPVRFIAAPSDAPCDACSRDASAPSRPAGQAFPSGQTHPPLHAGCACAIVPA
jgi:DivIVA domain-containing protein